MDPLVMREMRWFLNGPISLEASRWFEALPGKRMKQSYPRQDIYLVVPDRDDLGLKVREGRLEIKTRNSAGKEYAIFGGKVSGITEDWEKYTWDYLDRIGEISTPFERGLRVRMIKSRAQRKYEVRQDTLVPVDMDEKLDEAFVIELTELYSQTVDKKGEQSLNRRDWTIGCEVIASSDRICKVFERGTYELLETYDGYPLRQQDSYGYPRFAISVAAQL